MIRLSNALSLQLTPLNSIRCPFRDPNFDMQCDKFTHASNLLLEQLERTKLGDPSAPKLFRNLAAVVLCEKHNNQEERDGLVALWMNRQIGALPIPRLKPTAAHDLQEAGLIDG